MPTKNPRINVVLTPRIYADVQSLSEARGLSVSSVVEDLIEDALEIQEDIALAAFADERKKSSRSRNLFLIKRLGVEVPFTISYHKEVVKNDMPTLPVARRHG